MGGIKYSYSTTLSLFCLFFVSVLALTSCGSQPNAQAGQANKPAKQSTVTPHPETTDPTIAIDWVNFIHFQGIMYMAVSEQKQKLSAGDLDQVFDTIKF